MWYNIRVEKINAREWRNWQTRTFEGRVVHTVRVQVPFLAPSKRGRPQVVLFCLLQVIKTQNPLLLLATATICARAEYRIIYPNKARKYGFVSPVSRVMTVGHHPFGLGENKDAEPLAVACDSNHLRASRARNYIPHIDTAPSALSHLIS